ncbi:hypothetical protein H072_10942 [Dactylellina haptotyla CBS 200.50]|uniref:Uncharacterized protein n=1 Tax=Dactylellina haptotyla (strain CBS 200.50) TaxID=1284197 RepID=S8A3B3_DACHA|nr:hypothetical protein H072_10942 [Dactylellina haptotyla CBS 200.50]
MSNLSTTKGGADADGEPALVDGNPNLQLLHLAIKEDRNEDMKICIEKNELIECQDEFGRTPLYLAVFYRRLKMVEFLLSKNANANAACECKTTCLSKAAENGDIEILRLLLLNGALRDTQNQDGESPAQLAERNGHFLISSEFENHDMHIRNEFVDAARMGSVDKMKRLIKVGVDPNIGDRKGDLALGVAIKNDRNEVIQFLLDDDTLIATPKDKRVQSKDRESKTALHFASYKGDMALVELILNAGGNPDAQDSHGRTPWQYAMRGKHRKVADLLENWRRK